MVLNYAFSKMVSVSVFFSLLCEKKTKKTKNQKNQKTKKPKNQKTKKPKNFFCFSFFF